MCVTVSIGILSKVFHEWEVPMNDELNDDQVMPVGTGPADDAASDDTDEEDEEDKEEGEESDEEDGDDKEDDEDDE